MAEYRITFEEDTYRKSKDYLDAIGLDPNEVLEFPGAFPEEIIEYDDSLSKILRHKLLSEVLGKEFCSEVIEENDELKADVDKYGLVTVVDDFSSNDSFRYQLWKDEKKIRFLFKKLGLFAVVIREDGDTTTFLLPEKLQNKEHLLEDLRAVHMQTGFFSAYISQLDYMGLCIAGKELLYYARNKTLSDSDIDVILKKAGINPTENEVCVKRNKATAWTGNFKKYKLVGTEPDCNLDI